MNVIQEITSQTLSGTNDTASSIGELAEMAIEMKKSVSGFILPDSHSEKQNHSTEEPINEYPKEIDDQQLGAMFAVATASEAEEQVNADSELDGDAPDMDEHNGHELLNLDFTSVAEIDQDHDEDLQVDGEDELLHFEEFEAEIEAMLTDTSRKNI